LILIGLLEGPQNKKSHRREAMAFLLQA